MPYPFFMKQSLSLARKRDNHTKSKATNVSKFESRASTKETRPKQGNRENIVLGARCGKRRIRIYLNEIHYD
jgi:hypothetical protein